MPASPALNSKMSSRRKVRVPKSNLNFNSQTWAELELEGAEKFAGEFTWEFKHAQVTGCTGGNAETPRVRA